MTLARTPYARLSPADIGQVDRELKKLEQMSAGLYVPKVLVHARSPYTVQGTDTMLLCDCTAGAITLTFPLAARVDGMSVKIVKSDTSANIVTLSGTFGGVVNPTVTIPRSGFTVVAMNGAYHVTALVTYPVMASEAGVAAMVYPYGNPRRNGAAGDGVTVEDTAIANAVAFVAKTGQYGTAGGQGTRIAFPSGEFLANTPVDMTGSQKNLRGEGAYQTTIHANTGASGDGVAIDMSQSGFSTVRDVLLDVLAHGGGALPNPSRIGILQARNAANVQANNNHIYDTVVRLGHNGAAFGSRGTVALYNCCCENTTYGNVTLLADVGLFLGVGNLYGVTSPYVGTIGTNSSMTVIKLTNTSFVMGISGPAVRINGGAVLDLGDTSLFSEASQFSVTAYQYAIELLAQTTKLTYAGSMEGFNSLMAVSSILTSPLFDCYAAHDPSTANPRVHLVGGAGIVGGHLNVVPTPGTLITGSGTPSGNLIDCVSGQAAFLEGLDIELYGQGINLGTNGQILSCKIRSCDTVANTMGRIVAGGGMAGTEILCTDGYVLA